MNPLKIPSTTLPLMLICSGLLNILNSTSQQLTGAFIGSLPLKLPWPNMFVSV